MQRHHSLFAGLLLLSAASAQSQSSPVRPSGATAESHNTLPFRVAQKHAARGVSQLPLSFERNQGQTDPRVRFLTRSGDNTLFFTASEAVFTMPAPAKHSAPAQHTLRKRGTPSESDKFTRAALRMQMIGADPKAVTVQQQPLPGRINYFLGNDSSRWHAGVPTFGRVGFHGIYPGVDLAYYGNQQHLEYDFVVDPHADPRQIQLHFAGAQGVHVNSAGDLVVRTAGREMKWQKPMVYQQDATGKHSVVARFRLKRLPNGQPGVGFALGRYDTSRPLVIDPVLLYSTYVGGSKTGNTSYLGDIATSIAVDGSGNAYVAGTAFTTDFPVTAGSYQVTNPGIQNAFVTKVNSTGTALLYSTYIGGKTADEAYGIAVDGSGNAYLAGYASSSDFPTTPGAFQRVKNATSLYAPNAFVAKLNPTGTALLYSTFLGGSASPIGDAAYGIAIDLSGNAYITGSAQSTDFPTTPGAFQPAKNGTAGTTNAFVTKLNSTGTALLYSTYLGGTAGDGATGIVIDGDGDAYITGSAQSTDFPTTPGVFQPQKKAPPSGDSAFVTELNPAGSALVYSTYLGGSGSSSFANGITIDNSGNAYVTGHTGSLDFPTTAGAFQRVNQGTQNAFVTKLDPIGAALLYSTYLGGSGTAQAATDNANSITVDSSGNAYVAGSTNSPDFPTTPGAFQRMKKSTLTMSNAFVTKLNPTGTALLYSTYLGGSGSASGGTGDAANCIAIDGNGNAYVAGYAQSQDFPVTQGAFQTTNHFPKVGSTQANAFVTKLTTLPVLPDFNNDAHTDLLIQNSSTGQIASWFMQGSTWVGGAYFSLTPPIEYALVGAGDFSRNGATTLVLQSNVSNQIAFWYTNGANNATIPGGIFVSATPAAGWKVVGVGEFNGDGFTDLVFQNQTTNQIAVWFMNGAQYQGGVLLSATPVAGWKAVGTGDFNADGFTDIVFQNQTTGQIALWYMNRTTYAGGIVIPNVPAAGVKVAGVGDYNGDGYADLLLQNQTTNQATVWYLSNGVFQSANNLSLDPPAGWKIVGPH